MNARLRRYDGAVDGIDVLHGLVVRTTTTTREGDKDVTDAIAKHASSSEAPSGQSTLERILERASEVIGTREAAMRWLGSPVRALNYATPISLLVDDAGADQVLAVLANLENGVL